MKQIIKSLLLIKVGAGFVSSYLVHRKKEQATKSIEQSEFYDLMQRVRYHHETTRIDGFYKTRYHFKKKLDETRSVEAVVEDYRPTGTIALRDSLEIIVHSKDSMLIASQVVLAKPLITTSLVPDFIKNRVFSLFELHTEASISELESAYESLRQALNATSD